MMTSRCFGKHLVQLALVGAALVVAPAAPSAQAWLPAKGEGYISTVHTNVFVDTHYLPTERHDLGKTDSNVFLFDATYGVTDRIAVSVSLPLVMSRYRGLFPHPGSQSTVMDDGTWHTTFQDFRFNLRYKALTSPVVITPFIGTSLPSHKYEYWAHSAAGRRLRELHAGVTAARLLDEITSGLFVQGRCGFAFPERVVDADVNLRPYRSNADLEVGYFVSQSLRVFALGAGQLTHKGIDVLPPPIAVQRLTPAQRRHHDQIARDNFLNVGVGAAIDVTDSVSLFGMFLRQVAGRNSHQFNRAVSWGLAWSFGRQDDVVFISESEAAEQTLTRCVCQKAGGQ